MVRKLLLAHGNGGEETWTIIKDLFLKYLDDPILSKLEDAAVVPLEGHIAVTTDAFTVSPIFFRGGDIGKLAVCGTVNDLAAMGARPMYMTVSFILEEGMSLEDLETVVRSMGDTARSLGVRVVAGDTKVVPKGTADGVFIVSTGIGRVVYPGLSSHNVRDGDIIIVTGTIGDHGACILATREGLDFETHLESDCAPLWDMVEVLLKEGVEIHAMRDPTRGGLSAVLHEWARASGVSFVVDEQSVPVREEVRGLCEFLGLEPYHLACEGRMVLAVAEESAERVLEILRQHPLGTNAAMIGRAQKGKPQVLLRTAYGTHRFLEPPMGELLPRIC